MAPILQQYYEDMFAMMALPGWKSLLEDIETLKKQLDNVSTIKDAHNLSFRQGQLDIIELILKRKEMCEQVYEELQIETNV
jgi:hypothetical protein